MRDPDREAFEQLKPRLRALWSRVFPRDDVPYTSVIIPSAPPSAEDDARLGGACFREERLLFLLTRLRNPFARMVYVTSQPVHPAALDYYLQLLAGIPASHARARLTFLCCHDASPRPLAEKVLARPRLVRKVREALRDPLQAYLTVEHATAAERRLAVALDIPLNAADPDLAPLATKSGTRAIVREAGLTPPAGRAGVRTEDEIVGALAALQNERPGRRFALLKRDDGLAGGGNARVELGTPDLRDALHRMQPALPGISPDAFLARFARVGGVVEECLEGEGETSSPSVQTRISPLGEVSLTSTHEQILGGPLGQAYEGCRFPARDDYRRALMDAGRAVTAVLAARGVIGRVSIDFVAQRPAGGAWTLTPVDLNLRMPATLPSFFALRFLAAGGIDAETGLYQARSGRPKFYCAADALTSPAWVGLRPDDLVEIVTLQHLGFNPHTEKGVLFHTFGALSEHGRLGMVAVGDSREESESHFAHAIAILDREAHR